MAVQLSIIKNWFKRGKKPTEQQFHDTFDSFRHKSDHIPYNEVEGLSEAFQDTASKAAFENHVNDEELHGGGGGSGVLEPVSDIVALKDIDTSSPDEFPDKWAILVEDTGSGVAAWYRLDRESEVSESAPEIITPNAGTGRWISDAKINLDGKVNVSDKISTAEAEAGTNDTRWVSIAKVVAWWNNLITTVITVPARWIFSSGIDVGTLKIFDTGTYKNAADSVISNVLRLGSGFSSGISAGKYYDFKAPAGETGSPSFNSSGEVTGVSKYVDPVVDAYRLDSNGVNIAYSDWSNGEIFRDGYPIGQYSIWTDLEGVQWRAECVELNTWRRERITKDKLFFWTGDERATDTEAVLHSYTLPGGTLIENSIITLKYAGRVSGGSDGISTIKLTVGSTTIINLTISGLPDGPHAFSLTIDVFHDNVSSANFHCILQTEDTVKTEVSSYSGADVTLSDVDIELLMSVDANAGWWTSLRLAEGRLKI